MKCNENEDDDVISLSLQVIIAKANVNIVDMAHASVASLKQTIESLLKSNSPMQSLIVNNEEFCTLHEKVRSLEAFLKNFEKNNVSWEMTDFEVEVKEVANVVEQTIQLGVTEVVLENDENLREKSQERLFDSLQQVAEDVDHIWKEFKKIQDKGKHASKESTVQYFPSSSKDNVENNMVGRDDQRNAQCKLSLLRSTKVDKVFSESEAELADMLQKSLKGKRYLIVLDDIWTTEAWDAMRQCFPPENKGSGILLTTRNTEVAHYAGSKNSLPMRFMDQDKSLNLFRSVAFSSEELPSELETIGKQIADECHGLPLTIVVVAGHLKSKRAIEDWESVSKDVKSFVTNDPDERCSNVLGLSYDHLTSDLKACLLHFGIF
ncbi:hypothetical protein CQW23_06503 [Capsicum baccatum]|uniref:NB-ARC domain-containing protein n=1 Tax=Capsicum baccatum TaxID=33114 RepID=A0A2G2X3K7_CAPBA|nr:hypothetical protein CQW23_06503 [Capsicum baccatum]